MAYILKTLILTLLLCALTISADPGRIPTSHGRPPIESLVLGTALVSHAGNHNHINNHTSIDDSDVSQGRARRDIQGGPHSPQGDPHENQGRVRRGTQGGPHYPQGGPHSPQGGPHENQGRVRRDAQGGPNVDQGRAQENQGGAQENQAGTHVDQGVAQEKQDGLKSLQDVPKETEAEDSVSDKINKVIGVPCNATIDPRLSCLDCTTRMICKPSIGILISCNNRLKPYCNRGICSTIPSTECAATSVV